MRRTKVPPKLLCHEQSHPWPLSPGLCHSHCHRDITIGISYSTPPRINSLHPAVKVKKIKEDPKRSQLCPPAHLGSVAPHPPAGTALPCSASLPAAFPDRDAKERRLQGHPSFHLCAFVTPFCLHSCPPFLSSQNESHLPTNSLKAAGFTPVDHPSPPLPTFVEGLPFI